MSEAELTPSPTPEEVITGLQAKKDMAPFTTSEEAIQALRAKLSQAEELGLGRTHMSEDGKFTLHVDYHGGLVRVRETNRDSEVSTGINWENTREAVINPNDGQGVLSFQHSHKTLREIQYEVDFLRKHPQEAAKSGQHLIQSAVALLSQPIAGQNR